MKNNLILGLQGFIKVLTGTIFVVALIATDFAYTRDTRQAGAASGRGTTAQPSLKRRRTVTASRTSAKTKPTSSTLTPSAPPLETPDEQSKQQRTNWYLQQQVPWTDQVNRQLNADWQFLTDAQQNSIKQYYNTQQRTNWYLQQQVPWTDQVNRQLNADWQSLTDAQQNSIRQYYNTKMQQQSQPAVNIFSPTAQAPVQTQQQAGPFTSTPAVSTGEVPSPFAAPKEPVAKAKDQGILSTLWDYQSMLTKAMPDLSSGQAAALASVGTTAAIFAGPAMVGYLGAMGALKLGAGAILFDRIADAYSVGDISRTQAIENTKNGLEQFIADSGAYPTYKSQIEGLGNPNEFAIVAKLDREVVAEAKKQLIAEIRQKQDQLLQGSKEKQLQDETDAAIAALRVANFKGNHSEYAEALKEMNSAQCQAYISELTRTKTHVAVMREKAMEEKAKQEAATRQPTSAGEKKKPSTFLGVRWSNAD